MRIRRSDSNSDSVSTHLGVERYQLHEAVQGHLRDLEQYEIDKAVEKVKAAKARYSALLAQE